MRRRLLEWLRRYLPGELIGVTCALTTAWFVHRSTGSAAAAAIAGSTGEAVGFYGTALVRDMVRYHRLHRGVRPARRIALTVGCAVRDLAVELGPAACLDSLFIRPAMMYLMPQLTGQFMLGTLLGKLTADVFFYSFAITGYEVRKRLFPIRVPAQADPTIRTVPAAGTTKVVPESRATHPTGLAHPPVLTASNSANRSARPPATARSNNPNWPSSSAGTPVVGTAGPVRGQHVATEVGGRPA